MHGAKLKQIWHDAQHRPEAAKIGIAKLQEPTLKNGAGLLVKCFISGQIFGCQATDLLTRAHRVTIIIKVGAVVEIDTVKRQNGDDVEIFAGIWSAGYPLTDTAIFIQHMRGEIRFTEHRVVLLQTEQFLDEMRNR